MKQSSKKPSSAFYTRKLPTHLVNSPYVPQSNSAQLVARKPRRVSQKKSHLSEDAVGLERCYKRICSDDPLAFRLLLRNQEQFGRAKIPLQIRPDSVFFMRPMIKKRNSGNAFPTKKPPYVPSNFLNASKRKKITANLLASDEDTNSANPQRTYTSKYPSASAKHGNISERSRAKNKEQAGPVKRSKRKNAEQATLSKKDQTLVDGTSKNDIQTTSTIYDAKHDAPPLEEKPEVGRLKQEEILLINQDILDKNEDNEDLSAAPIASNDFFVDDGIDSVVGYSEQTSNKQTSNEETSKEQLTSKDVKSSSDDSGSSKQSEQEGQSTSENGAIDDALIDEFKTEGILTDQVSKTSMNEETVSDNKSDITNSTGSNDINNDINNNIAINLSGLMASKDKSNIADEDNQAVQISMFDENGDATEPSFYEPDSEEIRKFDKTAEEALVMTKQMSMRRKDEIKQLLDECSQIANDITSLELKS